MYIFNLGHGIKPRKEIFYRVREKLHLYIHGKSLKPASLRASALGLPVAALCKGSSSFCD